MRRMHLILGRQRDDTNVRSPVVIFIIRRQGAPVVVGEVNYKKWDSVEKEGLTIRGTQVRPHTRMICDLPTIQALGRRCGDGSNKHMGRQCKIVVLLAGQRHVGEVRDSGR
jgi:hypothetical protein